VAASPSSAHLQADSPLLGRQAPSLEGGKVLLGPLPSPSQMRGHFVVINFFADWCSSCWQEAGSLASFWRRESLRGMYLVMVDSFDPSASDALSFARRTGVRWSVVFDASDRLALDWGVRAPPETFVVAPDGEVIAKFVGPVTASALEGVA